MNLRQLAAINPITGPTGVVSFAPATGRFTPSNSPVDIFCSSQNDQKDWLNTIQDAQSAAAILRIGILIALAVNEHDPVSGLQTVPAMIGPAFFGGAAEFEKIQRQIDKIVTECKTPTMISGPL